MGYSVLSVLVITQLASVILALDGDIKLVDGPNAMSGRLEIQHRDEWGTVCDLGFDDTAAQVVCAQLGFGGGEAHLGSHYGPGQGVIWMSDVKCSGAENLLVQCAYDGWEVRKCDHDEDVSVDCGHSNPEMAAGGNDTGPAIPERLISAASADIRLVGGRAENIGLLEVLHEGQWGTVCDDGFNGVAAKVACKQLGYKGGEYRERAGMGSGHGTIWLSDLDCQGHENTLGECPHAEWGVGHCEHSEDIGLECF